MSGRARTVVAWSALLLTFVAVHVALGLFSGYDEYWGTGADVYGVYDVWVDDWLRTGVLVGVQADSVYPFLALAPILAASAFGTDTTAYYTTWMVIVLALDLVAVIAVARRRLTLGWWWLAFIVLLGPVVFARLDAIAIAVVIPGLVIAVDRPAVASAVFTIGAWIKIWPAALVLALVLAGRRVRPVVVAALIVSAVVVVVALLVGAGSHVLSFVTAQAGRGIQIEAPAALPWLWMDLVDGRSTSGYFSDALLTWQIRGPGTAVVAAVMTPVLAASVAAVVVAAVVARRRGVGEAEVLACSALGLVAALIAFNKVGSPQYATWFVAPVLLGLLVDRAAFRLPAVLVLVLAGLTQAVYPYLYTGLTEPSLGAIAVITVRNALEFVLFGWALARMLRPAAQGDASSLSAPPAAATAARDAA